jgi:ABC-type nitrate/sulfonate/bicarbonate transport system substrate-binding protein
MRITYMAPPAMASAPEAGAVQGFIAGAPSWAPPVIRGTGVVWISGPKREFPAGNMPTSQGNLQAMADFAQANPDLMQRLAAVIADVAAAVGERPAEVKAAVAKVYPALDAATLDLLFASESAAWRARTLTPEDVRHDIDFVRSSGIELPTIDAVDPASVLLPAGR